MFKLYMDEVGVASISISSIYPLSIAICVKGTVTWITSLIPSVGVRTVKVSSLC